MEKIEATNHVNNNGKHNEYFKFCPHDTKKRFINLYSSGKHYQSHFYLVIVPSFNL